MTDQYKLIKLLTSLTSDLNALRNGDFPLDENSLAEVEAWLVRATYPSLQFAFQLETWAKLDPNFVSKATAFVARKYHDTEDEWEAMILQGVLEDLDNIDLAKEAE